ncbi:MAG: hypothetical protein JWR45_3526 [Blastococcus sp.]|nr:hypothetical protein [Blastococcus sp.]
MVLQEGALDTIQSPVKADDFFGPADPWPPGEPWPLAAPSRTTATVARVSPRDLRARKQLPEDVQCRPVLTARSVIGVQSAVDEPGEGFGGQSDVW